MQFIYANFSIASSRPIAGCSSGVQNHDITATNNCCYLGGVHSAGCKASSAVGEPRVEEVPNPVGFEHVQVDDDMQHLYRENLDLDLALWTEKGTKSLTAQSLQSQLRHMRSLHVSTYVVLVAIRGNQIWLPTRMQRPTDDPLSCGKHCHWRVQHVISMLRQGVQQYNLSFPDTLFLLNMWDKPECKPSTRCAVPVFSPFKEQGDHDILIPPLFTVWHYGDLPLYNYPWDQKIPKAFMRANVYQCKDKRFGVCARYYLAKLGNSSQHGADLDAGLPDGYLARIPKGRIADHQGISASLPKADFVDLKDHAKYKYLINTDGTVASWRLAKIMHCNSPVLKQASDWIEWYYRSLEPGKHYMEFWKESRDDIFDVLSKLRSDDSLAQRIADNAQRFAFRYTHVLPKLLYFRQALLRYNALFDGSLPRLVAALPDTHMDMRQVAELAGKVAGSSVQ